MKKRIGIALLINLSVMVFSLLLPAGEIEFEVRLYEGFREPGSILPEVISSYSLNSTGETGDFPYQDISKERQSLIRIFNLKEVRLITLGNLRIGDLGSQKKSQLIVIKQKNIIIQLAVISKKENQYQVDVFEDEPDSKPLLETKVIIPPQKTAIIGFKDSSERTYFISFIRDVKKASLTKPSVTMPVTLTKPKLIHKVNPPYPEKAKEEGIQGIEIIQALIDQKGQINQVKTVKTSHMILNQSAVDAIIQWKYTPFYIGKRSIAVPLTVTINFVLEPDTYYSKQGQVHFSIDSTRLHFLKRIPPIYPARAVRENIQGTVVLMAFVDKNGYLPHIRVFKGNPVLADACVEAMKKWRFEPYLINGFRQSMLFTVTFSFTLDKSKAN
jgi:TonB family protein